jgi:hypothetical protein
MRLYLPFFPFGFFAKTLYALVLIPMLATCLADLILSDPTVLIISSQEAPLYAVFSSLCLGTRWVIRSGQANAVFAFLNRVTAYLQTVVLASSVETTLLNT